MKNYLVILSLATLFAACSPASSETQGFEVDELAKICAEGNGKLVSSTLVKAADGSISGEIKVDNSGTILDFKCTGDKDGGWGVEIINNETDSDAAAEGEAEAGGSDTATTDSADATDPAEQIMALYKKDGFEYISSETEVAADNRFKVMLTVRSSRGSEFTFACDGELVDGLIKDEYCEQE